jgi:sugar phosphate permease
MAIAGISFGFWRFLEIITLIPTLGMLAYFVHAYTTSNVLTPDFILVLFITSVLAAAWAIATLVLYSRSRNSGFFVAIVDLGFVGCFIAGVYLLRGIAHADCTNFTAGGFYFDLGILGYIGRNSDNPWSLHTDKNCAMLKASFAFGIMNCLFFFITFVSPASSSNPQTRGL